MAATNGVIRYNQDAQNLTIRVEGRATMQQSVPVRRLAETALEKGTAHLHFDLRDCTYMDSTFLGTILTLKRAVDRTGKELTLLAPSPACSKILAQMGLAEILPVETAPSDPPSPWTELTPDRDESSRIKQTVKQAHEELANLPGKVGEEFKAIVRCINDNEAKTLPPGDPRGETSQ